MTEISIFQVNICTTRFVALVIDVINRRGPNKKCVASYSLYGLKLVGVLMDESLISQLSMNIHLHIIYTATFLCVCNHYILFQNTLCNPVLHNLKRFTFHDGALKIKVK